MSDHSPNTPRLTSEQVDAITHAWLDLSASQEVFEAFATSAVETELSAACKDSVKELEDAFPFLIEDVEDEQER